MDSISVAQLPEYLARMVVLLKRIDHELDRYLAAEEDERMPDEDDLMDIYQLRDYVPGNPMINTVRGWMCFQQMPHYKIDRKLLFSRKAINKWIRFHAKKGNIECFKGLTEAELANYLVEDGE